ncbi:hypothetical protein AB0C04_21450 [Micromonospora sp. NPDC048909]|uniref:hypothetical protein n=1 Tax=Micromonospora sp. NPDC048909 TaxID=3155643 RepID=UPI0033EFC384
MADEIPLLGRLDYGSQLNLIVRLLEWTVEVLPSGARELLEGEGRGAVEAALDYVRAAAAGSPPDVESETFEELEDHLSVLADEVDLQDLWQLFVALSDSVGVPAEDVTVDFTRTIMSACCDVGDCEDLPELPLGTAEPVILDAERANANCMRAIEYQKQLVRTAAQD